MSKKNSEYHKKYYETNKDKQRDYYKQKVTCKICGAIYARSSTSNHNKSTKHLNSINDIQLKYEKLKKKYILLKCIHELNDKIEDSDISDE